MGPQQLFSISLCLWLWFWPLPMLDQSSAAHSSDFSSRSAAKVLKYIRLSASSSFLTFFERAECLSDACCWQVFVWFIYCLASLLFSTFFHDLSLIHGFLLKCACPKTSSHAPATASLNVDHLCSTLSASFDCSTSKQL